MKNTQLSQSLNELRGFQEKLHLQASKALEEKKLPLPNSLLKKLHLMDAQKRMLFAITFDCALMMPIIFFYIFTRYSQHSFTAPGAGGASFILEGVLFFFVSVISMITFILISPQVIAPAGIDTQLRQEMVRWSGVFSTLETTNELRILNQEVQEVLRDENESVFSLLEITSKMLEQEGGGKNKGQMLERF